MDIDSKLYNALERDLSAGYLTNWAARLYAREMDAHLAPLGLGSATLPVIFALAPDTDGTRKALTQRDLARHAEVEQPTMANTLARMERDGWIARRPNPQDKRSSLITLTPHALAHLPQLTDAVTRINARSLNGLSLEEATLLRTMLTRVIANLQTQA